MNPNIPNEEVYEAIISVADNFFSNLTGSLYWRNNRNKVLSGNDNISGIQIKFEIREFMKPDGMPVLPQSQINPEWLSAGSYFGIVKVKIPNEPEFSIQTPHNKPENQFHLQKGRKKIILAPLAENTQNYGMLGSGLFLKFETKEEAIKKIQEIRSI